MVINHLVWSLMWFFPVLTTKSFSLSFPFICPDSLSRSRPFSIRFLRSCCCIGWPIQTLLVQNKRVHFPIQFRKIGHAQFGSCCACVCVCTYLSPACFPENIHNSSRTKKSNRSANLWFRLEVYICSEPVFCMYCIASNSSI